MVIIGYRLLSTFRWNIVFGCFWSLSLNLVLYVLLVFTLRKDVAIFSVPRRPYHRPDLVPLLVISNTVCPPSVHAAPDSRRIELIVFTLFVKNVEEES